MIGSTVQEKIHTIVMQRVRNGRASKYFSRGLGTRIRVSVKIVNVIGPYGMIGTGCRDCQAKQMGKE
jgi:hypothetical protein